jgi:hypothetical protein
VAEHFHVHRTTDNVGIIAPNYNVAPGDGGIFLVIEVYGRAIDECPPQQNLHLIGPRLDVNQGEERHT